MRETNNLKALHECDTTRKVLLYLAYGFCRTEGNFIAFQYKKVKFPTDLYLRIKDQLDVICYFISLLMYSTCFGH